jgi:hypothetical protein
MSQNLLIFISVSSSNLSTKFLKRIRNCLSPKDEFSTDIHKWVEKRFSEWANKRRTFWSTFWSEKVQNQIKLPDIPLIGENTDEGSLFRVKCREYDFRACWIKVSLYYGDAMRQIRIGSWSVWLEMFDRLSSLVRIFIVWDFYFSHVWCFGIIEFLTDTTSWMYELVAS